VEKNKTELKNLEAELDLLLQELEKHDQEYGYWNSLDVDFFPASKNREREEFWTKAIALTAEYLDPTEFATVVAEQLDQTFYMETDPARNPNKKGLWGTYYSEEAIQTARNIVESISTAIEKWAQAHGADGRLKNLTSMKSEERQAKTVQYFLSLMDSYRRGKKDSRTDEEMLYTIRQMEVALNLLGNMVDFRIIQ
jgi:hypothetical protein